MVRRRVGWATARNSACPCSGPTPIELGEDPAVELEAAGVAELPRPSSYAVGPRADKGIGELLGDLGAAPVGREARGLLEELLVRRVDRRDLAFEELQKPFHAAPAVLHPPPEAVVPGHGGRGLVKVEA